MNIKIIWSIKGTQHHIERFLQKTSYLTITNNKHKEKSKEGIFLASQSEKKELLRSSKIKLKNATNPAINRLLCLPFPLVPCTFQSAQSRQEQQWNMLGLK